MTVYLLDWVRKIRAGSKKDLWKEKIHRRHKILWWLISVEAIAVGSVITRRVGSLVATCPLCGEDEESLTHVFLFCRLVCPIWFMSIWSLWPELLGVPNMLEFLELAKAVTSSVGSLI